ncbi:MAG: hypothetical protein R3182_01790, partial [Draconibacterium sp.]|nr:hypothetical protein [Draconibacterium sp.]
MEKGNKLYFDVHDQCNFDGKISIRLVWLDVGYAKWQLTYNGSDSSERIAFSNNNSNSGVWKEKTIFISDAKFRNSGPKSSDIVIENLSESESIVFHLIEILKEED